MSTRMDMNIGTACSLFAPPLKRKANAVDMPTERNEESKVFSLV